MRRWMSATTAATCAGGRAWPVVDEDAHRPVVFADPVGAAGDLEFGAEGDLEKAVGDLGVGEGLALGGAALGDLGMLGGGGNAGEDQRKQRLRRSSKRAAGWRRKANAIVDS